MAYEAFRVLLIDDDADTLQLYSVALGRQHYDILRARDGKEGLEMAFTADPDVVLLDLMMPGMDGYEVCRRLRHAPKTADLPVLILTNLSGASARQKAHEIGADDFVTKGEPLEHLDGRIKMLIKQRILAHTRSWLDDLPGSVSTDYMLRGRLAAGLPTAAAHLDVKHLREFNAHAGLDMGDKLLWTLARLLRRNVEEEGKGDFVGYRGQDDFIIIMEPERAPARAQALLDACDKECRKWADGVALSGHLPGLSLAMVITDGRYEVHPAQLFQTLDELLEELRKMAGSTMRVARLPA